MTLRRLGILQWVGLIAGGAVWIATHVVGYGLTEAECHSGRYWGIGNDVWQATLTAIAALLILGAQAAAITVVLRTRETSYDRDPPPPSRMQFLAIGALVANLLFLVIVLLDGIGAIFSVICRQA